MIYWDANASSPLRPCVKKAMHDAMDRFQGNPNSAHFIGQQARHLIEETRGLWAQLLKVQPHEIIFTGSASESNFLWLWNSYLTRQSPDQKLLIGSVEHSSIYENAGFLAERFGLQLVEMPVMTSGVIDIQAVEDLLKNEGPWLSVSLIGAQNETGVIQPWQEVASLCSTYQIPFHSDAVQLLGRSTLHLDLTGLTSATLGFHKIGGPKGIGILVVREGHNFEPVMRGGGQENKRRPGTENILALAGLNALALEVSAILNEEMPRLRVLRDLFEREFRSMAEKLSLSFSIIGESASRLPQTSFVVMNGIRSDKTLMALSLNKICASSGSACSSGMLKPSHSLLAMGYSHEEALSGVRFSLTENASESQVQEVVRVLKDVGDRITVGSPQKTQLESGRLS